ncbi:AUGMIN subunit 1 [Spatholobus suberectus]|nr:AUGMIN subunit 1 [Spatholobus suberectus]
MATTSEKEAVAKAKEWLAKTFEGAEKVVLVFEYTPCSVSHLHLVARDFRLKASKYRSQDRIRYQSSGDLAVDSYHRYKLSLFSMHVSTCSTLFCKALVSQGCHPPQAKVSFTNTKSLFKLYTGYNIATLITC